MLVPLNTSKRDDICLSVVRLKDRFSVKVVSIVDGYSSNPLPSYSFNLRNEEIEPVIWMEDYPAITGKDLYDCIEQCMKQIEELL